MNEAYPFEPVVQQALRAYGLDDAPRVFLQHTENVTYKIEPTSGLAYLLRLHLFANNIPGNATRLVNSEMLWLQALQREAQLPVPAPIANQQGQLVTEALLDNKQHIRCTLLQWLEGEPYTQALEDEDSAAQIGHLIGKLHLHASRWRQPRGFIRPSRDLAFFENALAKLQTAVNDGRLGYQDFRTFETSISILTAMLRVLPTTRQTEGLLHGDLHRGNFLIHKGQVRLIDFSLCAYGNYMFDLGICLADMSPHLHAAMLLNYDRFFHLPVEYKRLIEGFYIGSFIGTLASFLDLPHTQETLIRKTPLVAREYATRFNNDERFWFEHFT